MKKYVEKRKEELALGYVQNLVCGTDIEVDAKVDFEAGFDAGYAEGQAELDECIKLNEELSDQVKKNVHAMYAVARENDQLCAKIAIHESKASQFESTLSETMRVRDEYKAKLSLAIATLELVVKQSGSSTDYNLSARKTLAELKGGE